MKTKFFLAAGLLVNAMGFSQTTTYPTGTAGTGGTNNVYIGHNAGTGVSNTGIKNVFTGYEAGLANAIGQQNTFTGFQAGLANTTGQQNSFTGSQAGKINTTGFFNSFYGTSSGDGNNNGTPITSNTAGQNSFFGAETGRGAYGINNVFIGFQAGRTATGANNVFVGVGAGNSNINDGNLFCGHYAGGSSKAANNVFLGSSSGRDNINGIGNTFTGVESGRMSGNGEKNVYSGYRAGYNATGNKNVCLGYEAGYSIQGDNKLAIANSNTLNPLIYGEFKTATTPGILKFNAYRVGIGYEDNFGFEDFPTSSTFLPDIINLDEYRLFVKGGILAYEVRVRIDWADYVFAKDYKLLSLKDTEAYIAQNGHLPNMPSAAQVAAEGIELGTMAKLQQEKIEELTLHLIEQNKKLEKLEAQVQLLLNKQ